MKVMQPTLQKYFTTVSNILLWDTKLSANSKFLMTLMYSLPNNWEFNINGLVSVSGLGKKAISTALTQLEERGYLVREQKRTENGLFESYDYQLFYTPQNLSAEDDLCEISQLIESPLLREFDDSVSEGYPNICSNRTRFVRNRFEREAAEGALINKYNNKKKYIKKNSESQKKVQFAEFVTMTETEHSNLIEKFGVDGTAKWIERLDDYKASTGKKYLSDYRTILNWSKKDAQRNQPQVIAEKPKPVSYQKFWDEALAFRKALEEGNQYSITFSSPAIENATYNIDWEDDLDYQKQLFITRIKEGTAEALF